MALPCRILWQRRLNATRAHTRTRAAGTDSNYGPRRSRALGGASCRAARWRDRSPCRALRAAGRAARRRPRAVEPSAPAAAWASARTCGPPRPQGGAPAPACAQAPTQAAWPRSCTLSSRGAGARTWPSKAAPRPASRSQRGICTRPEGRMASIHLCSSRACAGSRAAPRAALMSPEAPASAVYCRCVARARSALAARVLLGAANLRMRDDGRNGWADPDAGTQRSERAERVLGAPVEDRAHLPAHQRHHLVRDDRVRAAERLERRRIGFRHLSRPSTWRPTSPSRGIPIRIRKPT